MKRIYSPNNQVINCYVKQIHSIFFQNEKQPKDLWKCSSIYFYSNQLLSSNAISDSINIAIQLLQSLNQYDLYYYFIVNKNNSCSQKLFMFASNKHVIGITFFQSNGKNTLFIYVTEHTQSNNGVDNVLSYFESYGFHFIQIIYLPQFIGITL